MDTQDQNKSENAACQGTTGSRANALRHGLTSKQLLPAALQGETLNISARAFCWSCNLLRLSNAYLSRSWHATLR
jgi:hypothetical protein